MKKGQIKELREEAIQVVKRLVIELLEQDKFCDARETGEALEKIIRLKQEPTFAKAEASRLK